MTEVLKLRGAKLMLIAITIMTIITTMATINPNKTTTLAAQQKSPFFSTGIGDNVFEVNGDDLVVHVIRKGTDTGPLGFCLNKYKFFPTTKDVIYTNDIDADWSWEIDQGRFPTETQVKQVHHALFNYRFLYNEGNGILSSFGFDEDDSMARYSATQVTIWAILEGWTIDDIKIRDEVKEDAAMYATAQKLHKMIGAMIDDAKRTDTLTFTPGAILTKAGEKKSVDTYTITADDMVVNGDNSYYRSPLYNMQPNQSYGTVISGDYALTYTVALENAPEGSRVVNAKGKPQTTFSYDGGIGSDFYVEIPASAVIGNTNEITVKATTTVFRRLSPVLWTPDTSTAYQSIAQLAAIPDTGKAEFKISYSGLGGLAELTVEKEAEQFTGFVESNGAYVATYQTKPLKGVEFTVSNKDTFKGTDLLQYQANKELGKITTGDNGNGTLSALPMNLDATTTTYVVKETKAPVGYYVSENPTQEATLTKVGDGLAKGSVKFMNERVKFGFELTKKYEASENEYLPLEGAVFGVYANEKIGTLAKDTLIAKLTSNMQGLVSGTALDLPMGYDFYIKELETRSDLVLDANKYYFSTDLAATPNDRSVVMVDVKDEAGAKVTEIINMQKLGGLTIEKLVETYNSEKNTFEYTNVTDADGFKFEVYKDATRNFKVAEITNKNFKDGKFVLDNLKTGTYYIYEVSSPILYTYDEKAYTAEVKTEEITNVVIKNALRRATVEVFKNDVTHPDYKVPMKNVRFTLTMSNNTLFEATTDSNGLAKFVDIPCGYNYTLVEDVPAGYIGPDEVIIIPLAEPVGTYTQVVGNIKTDIRGSIQIVKLAGDTNKLLAGAEFRLYRSSDAELTTPIATETTTEDGFVIFSNLTPDVYIIHESDAPEGYLVAEDITVDLTNIRNGHIEDVRITDAPFYGEIKIQKIDGETKEALSGVEFVLYRNGEALETKTTDKDGFVLFNNVRIGDYQVKETKTLEGYILNTNPINVEVVDTKQQYDYVVENFKEPEPFFAHIKIQKVDGETNAALEGAEFALYKDGAVVTTKTTGTDGTVLFENVELGKYQVKETKAPQEYVLENKTIDVDVTEEKNFYEYTVKNYKEPEPFFATIKIQKIDHETQEALAGAEFTLYKGNKEIATKATDANGIILFEGIEPGDYEIKETKAPEGYSLKKDAIEVEVTEEKELYEYVVENYRMAIQLQIKKLDSNDHRKSIEGVEFKVYKTTDVEFVNPITTIHTNADGIARIERLPLGSYILVESKPAEGYQAPEKDIALNVANLKDGSTVDVTVYNTKVVDIDPEIDPEPPEIEVEDPITGVSMNGVLYASCMIMIVVGAGMIIYGYLVSKDEEY